MSEHSHTSRNQGMKPAHGATIQRKLTVSRPGDDLEREAERVSARVAEGKPVEGISRRPATQAAPGVARSGAPDKKEPVAQRAALAEKREPAVQRVAQPEKKEPVVQRAAAPEKKEPAVQRVAQPEKKEPVVQRAAAPEKKEPVVQRAAAPEKKEPVVQRAGAPEKKEPIVQRSLTDATHTDNLSDVAQRAVETKGGGKPLSPKVRASLEGGLGADFSEVRIHDDELARTHAADLGARAFTHGNDIWLGPGESAEDLGLMAHEATHVVQQGAVAQGTVQRASQAESKNTEQEMQLLSPLPASGNVIENPPILILPALEVPDFKKEWHMNKLPQLLRRAAYARGNPNQSKKWENHFSSKNGKEKLLEEPFGFKPDRTYIIEAKSVDVRLVGSPDALAMRLSRPFWTRTGDVERHEVDHMVELQVSGWPTFEWANEIENMNMLNRSANGESGNNIKIRLEKATASALASLEKSEAPSPAPSDSPAAIARKGATGPTSGKPRKESAARKGLSHYNLRFRAVTGFANPSSLSMYSRDDIEKGEHISAGLKAAAIKKAINIYDAVNRDPKGGGVFSAWNPELANILGADGKLAVHFKPYGSRFVAIFDKMDPSKNPNSPGNGISSIRGMHIDGIDFHPKQDPVGVVHGRFFPKQSKYAQDKGAGPYGWKVIRLPGLDYAGYLDPKGPREAIGKAFESPAFSPIEFDDVGPDEDSGSVKAVGKIHASLPILNRCDLDIVLEGDDLRVEKEFSPGDFALPGPIQVTDSSLVLSIGMLSGLGIRGDLLFSIPSVGSGRLAGAAKSGVGQGASFALEGEFNVERGPFDPARLIVRYRDGEFSGEGELGIRAGTVPGIRSATVKASLDKSGFRCSGIAQLTVPGVQAGTLSVSYSKTQGLSVGGSFELSKNIPCIEGGKLEAELRELPNGAGWSVTASGTARPRIPGVDASIVVRYENGAITAEGHAAYSKGMLSGGVDVGVTNRVLDKDGRPTDALGSELRAYGGGTVTVRIAPWLQGTVGVRLLPNGEVELSGAIGLPSALTVFPEKSLKKNIFSIGLDIPILGFAVAGQRVGIFATIGGGLDLSAGVGPGELQQLGLSITYNPSHEEQTRVQGKAKLVVPAYAGLRLYIQGALGAGIPIVSASMGLEVGGELGLRGAAEASVVVDYTPSRGLVLDALGEVFVQPKFKFDLTGFLKVEADLVLTSIMLYEKRWKLAEFEAGPSLRLGVRFPVHYEQGKPFEIPWDRVEFVVPSVDTRALLKDIVDRIV